LPTSIRQGNSPRSKDHPAHLASVTVRPTVASKSPRRVLAVLVPARGSAAASGMSCPSLASLNLQAWRIAHSHRPSSAPGTRSGAASSRIPVDRALRRCQRRGVVCESLGLTSHKSSCNCTGCGMLRAGVCINCAREDRGADPRVRRRRARRRAVLGCLPRGDRPLFLHAARALARAVSALGIGRSRSGSAWLGRSQKDGLPSYRGGYFIAVQGLQLAHREGQPGRCPLPEGW